MSRPPPSTAFPPIPRGGQQIPPFPQLLHLKDSPPVRRTSGENTPIHGGPSGMGTPSQSSHPPPRSSFGTPSAPSGPLPHPILAGLGGGDRSSAGPEDAGSIAASPEAEDDDDTGDHGNGGAAGDEKKRRPHATRRRVVQSCSECRRRKIKCDKKFPCGPCILRSDQARCHEVGMAEKNVVASSSSFATAGDLAQVAHRLDALEAALVKTGALLPADLEHFLRTMRAGEYGLEGHLDGEKRVKMEHPGPTTADQEAVDDTEGAALTLEHLAFGRSRVEGSHSIPHFGSRVASSISRSAPNNNYHLARSSLSHGAGVSPSGSGSPNEHRKPSGPAETLGSARASITGGKSYAETLTPEERAMRIDALLDLIGPTDVFDLFYRRTEVALRALTKVLPTRERGEMLVKAYLEKVDWLHRCLHIPTFLRQCADLWALPQDAVVHEIALPFVGLYFTVCTLGMQFMETSEVAKHFTPEEAETLPDLWFNAARSALWAADFMGTHTTEGLQCLILLGVFMNNRDRGEAAWALLGAAIKMAQGLGLSRLGAEQQSVEGKPLPMWTGRWESLIQREVGRRIWWNLVFLDWALAPSYNFSCSIHPDQIKTALPANIEDEDLTDDQPLNPQPLNVRTGMSFSLARIKFAEITHRQIWQANNASHPPYSFILSVDGELRKAMMELPAFFQPDPSDRNGPPSQDPKSLVQYYEKIMLNLAIHSRMLRLHRPWLSRGYEDERFAYSKEQCIRAARASLRMMSDNNGTAAFLEKWWIPLFYVSVSGLVVIIDLLRTNKRDMHSLETEQKINEVKGALGQMRMIADVSHPSRAAVRVMDFLLAEVEERRRPGTSSLGKRKASSPSPDADDGLQRAVKKLIQQAALEAESPSQPSTGTPTSNARQSISPYQDASRERPVFDAYPAPTQALAPSFTFEPMSQPGANGRPGGSGIPQEGQGVAGLQVPASQTYQQLSPFTFPIDTSSNSYAPPNMAFLAPTQAPQLDPAVESMLANYFPQNPQSNAGGMAGPATVPQVPDDFLSRVFSFSWENNNANNNAANGHGNATGNNSGNNGNGQGQGGMGGAGQMNGGAGGLDALGGFGAPGMPFEQWGSGGWMA